MSRHTIHNERIKLTANSMNGIALAVLAVGAFAPLFAFLYGTANPGLPDWVLFTGFAICVLASLALHWVARWVLGRIKT